MQEMSNALLMIYEMINNSPHKQSRGASGKAPGHKVSNCLLQFLKQMSQLLQNKRNMYEVPIHPIIRSTVGRWVDPAVEFRFFRFVFNSIYSRVGD